VSKEINSVVFVLGEIPETIYLDASWTHQEKRKFLYKTFESRVHRLVNYTTNEVFPFLNPSMPTPNHYNKLADLALKKGKCKFNIRWLMKNEK
jgi:hypothetical protein